jgi:hypothetical protein
MYYKHLASANRHNNSGQDKTWTDKIESTLEMQSVYCYVIAIHLIVTLLLISVCEFCNLER